MARSWRLSLRKAPAGTRKCVIPGSAIWRSERSVNFLGEPYVNQGNRLVFFTDCDGNLVHLIQREKPLP